MKEYNKEIILKDLNNLSIQKVGNTVVTKFYDRVICTEEVSSKYEVFDISKFIIERIEQIEENFKIKEYQLYIKGGIQKLILRSDTVMINGIEFRKTFFILNSSNRTRKLNFNVGLTSNDFIFIGRNIDLVKRHLTGITDIVYNFDLNSEVFDEQIEYLQGLGDNLVSFLDLENGIIGDNENSSNLEILKKFKSKILNFHNMGLIELDNESINYLRNPDLKLKRSNNFYIDAFMALRVYLSIFMGRSDSHIIKKQTSIFMDSTINMVRKKRLKEFLS